jgi:D-alanine-D-alanine ligase
MKSIAVLTGGESSEREVSMWSADHVEGALRDRTKVARYVLPEDRDRFLAERQNVDVVIPVLHGRGGEDGVLQGFLSELRMPFLFSGVEACAIGMDKRLAKLVAQQTGIQTPRSEVVVQGQKPTIAMPFVVKPLDGGSTIGVSVVKTEAERDVALTKAFAWSREVLIEGFIDGREFTVGVIEDQGRVIGLPVIEIVSPGGFFDFESKYIDGKMASEICPAQIPDALRDALQTAAVTMHRAVGARHVSRSDFIVDEVDQPWFLEINIIPGMTKNSLLPKAVRQSGRDFGDLLVSWIDEVTSPPARERLNPAAPRS